MYNPLINEDFVSYLICNGYNAHESDDKTMVTCVDRRTSVQFKNDTATFWTYYDGGEDEAPDFKEYGSVSGLAHLDAFKWQLICHAFNVVPLQQFIQRAKREISPIDQVLKSIFPLAANH